MNNILKNYIDDKFSPSFRQICVPEEKQLGKKDNYNFEKVIYLLSKKELTNNFKIKDRTVYT